MTLEIAVFQITVTPIHGLNDNRARKVCTSVKEIQATGENNIDYHVLLSKKIVIHLQKESYSLRIMRAKWLNDIQLRSVHKIQAKNSKYTAIALKHTASFPLASVCFLTMLNCPTSCAGYILKSKELDEAGREFINRWPLAETLIKTTRFPFHPVHSAPSRRSQNTDK